MGKELKGLGDSAKHEPEEVQEDEDEEEIAFGSAFGMVIGWCLGQRLGGDGVGIWVVFGWLNKIGVCSSWVWDLLAVGLLPWV